MTKTYVLNFNLEEWVKYLEIEANNEEEALEKLGSMTTQEIFNNACCSDCPCITDIDVYCLDDEDDEDDVDEEDEE